MADHRSFYSNSVVVGVSSTDFTLIFQQRGIPTGPVADGRSETVVVDSLQVGLSPGQAKLLAISLTNVVATYEKDVGSIPLSEVDKKKHNIK